LQARLRAGTGKKWIELGVIFEVVPDVVGFEVAVPRLRSAEW
jgi:hypothetical protein